MGKRWWLKKKKELGLIPDDDAGKPSMFDGFGLYTLFPWLRRPKKDPNAGEYTLVQYSPHLYYNARLPSTTIFDKYTRANVRPRSIELLTACTLYHVSTITNQPPHSADDSDSGAPAGGFLPGPELREYLQRVEDNKAFDINEEIESHQRMVAGRERK